MKFASKWAGLIAVLALAASAPAQDGVKLKRVAKTGDTMVYKMSALVDFQGTEIVFSATVTEKVTNVASDGKITVESKQGDVKVKFGDQEMNQEGMETTSTVVSAANGAVLELKGDDTSSDAYRRANMMGFIFPDNALTVGHKWSQEYKADTKTGAVAAKAEYEVVAMEKVNTWDSIKIKFSYKETSGDSPASTSGQVWLNTADGSLIKVVTDVKAMPVAGAPMPIDGKITMERTK